MVSIANDDATPQMPPIATPYNTRNSKKTVSERRGGGEQLKHREEDDIQHQDRLAAIFFRRTPEDQRANRAHRQREQNRQRHLFQTDVKGLRDVTE